MTQTETVEPVNHNRKGVLPELHQFWKPLFMVTVGLNMVLLLLCQWQWPALVVPLGQGMALGLFYLLTLKTSSSNPVPKIQFAVSTLRMAIFAALIVWVGNFEILRTLVVILGCFSYKMIIMAVAVRSIIQN